MSGVEEINNQISTGEASADSNQYLTFSLGSEEYGVDILSVQEIKGYVPTTRMPNSPPEVVGVLNLRGTVVPVVDLRRKFNLEAVTYDQFTVIVVVVVNTKVMGMIVDRVSEVMSIPVSDIQSPDGLDYGLDTKMIRGVAKTADKLIILLNVDSVLNANRTGDQLQAAA